MNSRCGSRTRARVRDIRVKSSPSDVARASRPLCCGHPARPRWAFHVLRASSFPIKRLGFILARERDAPATAGGTPALRPMDTAFTFMSRTRYQLSVISTFSSHRPAELQLEN